MAIERQISQEKTKIRFPCVSFPLEYRTERGRGCRADTGRGRAREVIYMIYNRTGEKREITKKRFVSFSFFTYKKIIKKRNGFFYFLFTSLRPSGYIYTHTPFRGGFSLARERRISFETAALQHYCPARTTQRRRRRLARYFINNH